MGFNNAGLHPIAHDRNPPKPDTWPPTKDHHQISCRKASVKGQDLPTCGIRNGCESRQCFNRIHHRATLRDLHGSPASPHNILNQDPSLNKQLVSRQHKTLVASTTAQNCWEFRTHDTLSLSLSRHSPAPPNFAPK